MRWVSSMVILVLEGHDLEYEHEYEHDHDHDHDHEYLQKYDR